MTAGETADSPSVVGDGPLGAPGTVLANRYVLGAVIGQGGMGRVYRAHDRLLNRDIAVKLLFADTNGDHDTGRACAAEARAAAALNHPGVARIFDGGVEDGHCFIVMELVEGRMLGGILARSGRLAIPVAVDLAAQVAAALDHAHAHGVVHCDVKPGNILVTEDGTAKLVDFGIAHAASLTGTLPLGELRGSAAYMSPEQARGERVDGRSDVYALGAVLFELVTGRPPFQGGSLAAVITQRLVVDPPSPRRLNPDVSRILERTILTALARDAERRYQTAGQFRDALRAVLAGEPVDASIPGGAALVRRLITHSRSVWTERRGLVALGAGGLVALALSGAALVSGWSAREQPGDDDGGDVGLVAPPPVVAGAPLGGAPAAGPALAVTLPAPVPPTATVPPPTPVPPTPIRASVSTSPVPDSPNRAAAESSPRAPTGVVANSVPPAEAGDDAARGAVLPAVPTATASRPPSVTPTAGSAPIQVQGATATAPARPELPRQRDVPRVQERSREQSAPSQAQPPVRVQSATQAKPSGPTRASPSSPRGGSDENRNGGDRRDEKDEDEDGDDDD